MGTRAAFVKVFVRDRAGDVESLWCTVADAKDRFRVASIPLSRATPAYDDEIVATPGRDGILWYRRVATRGGYRTAMLEYAKRSTFRPLVAWLRAELGVLAEGCLAPRAGEPGVVLLAVPARVGVARALAAAAAKFPGVRAPGR